MTLVLIVLNAICLLGLGVGLWLLLRPGQAPQVLAQSATLGWLRRSWRVERHLYRRHRLFGGFVALASLVVFITLQINLAALLHTPALAMTKGLATVVETLSFFLLLATPFTFAFGAVILVRPSALKGIESWSNQRITREMVQGQVQRLRNLLLGQLATHPRLLGLLIMLGSALVFYFAEW